MRHAGKTIVKIYGLIVSVFYVFYALVTKSSYEGAMTSLHCAVDDSIPNYKGYYFSDCKPKKPSKAARNDKDAERLWELSCEMVNLKL